VLAAGPFLELGVEDMMRVQSRSESACRSSTKLLLDTRLIDSDVEG